jgi:hypothetical protein
MIKEFADLMALGRSWDALFILRIPIISWKRGLNEHRTGYCGNICPRDEL